MPRKPSNDDATRPIFRNDDELFDDSLQKELEAQKIQPVVCLGLTFPNDAARRKHFLDKLREKLQDPEFRKIEGFPIGNDEDILALSDPPYYTACPNPFIADFIKQYGTPYDPEVPYSREPFASDVSEGKNDPIYNAHYYHTKVPHKAIMRYILHYTKPGDVVLDTFCGTGMTGLAAQLCGDRIAVESLGYRVSADGVIAREEIDESGKEVWHPFSQLGVRRAIINDLSPAATFISYNQNTSLRIAEFEREAERIIAEVQAECGWMYETLHTDGRTAGSINYTVWSDVFICSECNKDVVFWAAAVDKTAGEVRDEFDCPHCSATLSKRSVERAWTTVHDDSRNSTIRQAKQTPVLINYTAEGRRREKSPDAKDMEVFSKVQHGKIPYWFPTTELPDGYNTRQPKRSHGVTHVHHFYTKRNLWVLAAVLHRLKAVDPRMLAWFTSTMSWVGRELRLHLGNYFGGGGGALTSLRGTLYIASLSAETNVLERLALRTRWQAFRGSLRDDCALTSTGGAANTAIPPDTCDYIFIDPPFGANINYSELNSLLEAWLGVTTNTGPEAIENSVQEKSLSDYRGLMTNSFRAAYRALKPGRWITIEFSNTQAAVWNSIQTALTEAGFIVANVSALDKKKGGFKAVTTPTAVKQDLVITAYKPNGGFEDRFKKEAATEDGVWDFVRTHLGYLPVVKRAGKAAQIVTVAERDPRILFDRMVAYYVKSGIPVPVSSGEFQQGLAERFAERDGMYFLPEQAAEYDKRRALAEEMAEQVLFVSDEASAIRWLRKVLKEKPQIFSDVNGQFMQQLGGWSKHEQQLDLRVLLDQNFLEYDGSGPVPEQIHAYLSSNWKELRNLPKNDPKLREKAENRWYVPDPNKAGDLEKLREKALLKEFEEYRDEKRLRVFRIEAVRVGFKAAYDRQDYKTIVAVAAKLPETVLQEDEKLLMYYDVATMRLGDEGKGQLFDR